MRDDKHDFCLLSGHEHFFDWSDGAIKPMLYGCGDVFGCGLVLSADDKLAIFFTANGTLMGQLSHIRDMRKFNLLIFILLTTVTKIWGRDDFWQRKIGKEFKEHFSKKIS
jgi:hypothetical protein